MDETRIEKALEEIFNNSIRGACGFCYYRQERALYMNINLHVPLNIMLKFSHFFFLFIAILITTFFSTSPLTDIINQGLVLTFRRGGGGGGGKEEIWLCPNNLT